MTTQLASRDNCKTLFGIALTNTRWDAQIDLLITRASALIEEFCGRTFGLASYTEFIAGNNAECVWTINRPLVSVTSLYFDPNAWWGQAPGAFPPGTLWTEGVDYAVRIDQTNGTSRSGLIQNIRFGTWPKPCVRQVGQLSPGFGVTGNIRVTYVAGYDPIPADLQSMCEVVVSAMRNLMPRGFWTVSENLGAYSYTLAMPKNIGDLLEPIRGQLGRYRNWSLA